MMSTAAHAETVGVSMALFDDNFLTVLRNGMQDYAETLDGVTLQVEDAQNDVAKQQSQIQNFIAAGVDAIIVNPVDTDATAAMSKIAADAGIPLVYVNREPVNVDTLPEKQAFVASNEMESGTLETQEVCQLLGGKGKTVVMMGELSNQAARACAPRTSMTCIATPRMQGHRDRRGADGQLVAHPGRRPDDQLAVGRPGIRRRHLQQRRDGDRRHPGAEGCRPRHGQRSSSAASMRRRTRLPPWQPGDLDVTVFQNAAGQGKGRSMRR